MKEACLAWKNSFDNVSLVFPETDFSNLSSVHREDLRALNNFGINMCLVSGEIETVQNNGTLIAQLSGGGVVYTFATDAVNVNSPNSDWLNLTDSYLLKSRNFALVSTVDVDETYLFDQPLAGDVEVDIMDQCNGLVSEFGSKLWDELISKSPAISSAINADARLESITYSDSYICSPWNLMLFAELIDGLKSAISDSWNNPEIYLSTGDKPANPKAKGLYAEWRSASEKSEVITEYFAQMGENICVDIKAHTDIAHGRVLTLVWAGGIKHTVRLDHGFGCWSIDGKPSKWFDINESPETQVSDLYSILRTLKVRFSKKFHTQVFVKKIS